MKPRVFIGSSIESLNIAYAVQEGLEHDVEVTVWDQGIFELSNTAIDDLLKTLDNSDFAIFIFSPDDTVTIRKEDFLSIRDNVVFELGLFVGRLGKERNFIVLPKDQPGFRLPTDLIGINPATFDANRSDGNLLASLGPACNKIRGTIAKLGIFTGNSEIPRAIVNQPGDAYYHIRVQRFHISRKENPADEPEFLFNQKKSSITVIAKKLHLGDQTQIAGVPVNSYDINYGNVTISILRSKEQVVHTELTGTDTATKEQFWDKLINSENIFDITNELDISMHQT